MRVSPAREAALRVISRVRRDAAFSGPVLAAELRKRALSPDDAALATRIAYGTLATTGVLDEIIDGFARGSLEPRVRDSLRAGAYELLFARTPAYAVVDQTVEAVRGVRPAAAPLSNAVMRKIAAVADDFPFGDPERDEAALARATGHPRWIVDMFMTSLGRTAALEALRADLGPAPTYVRLDPFSASAARTVHALETLGAGPRPSPPDAECFVLEHPAAAYRAGAHDGFFPMDAASQMAPLASAPASGMRIADVGAGRGNKTVCLQALAMRMGGPARITAVDLHAGKSSALRARLDGAGVPSVQVVTADAEDLGSVPGFGAFDLLLLDAPCTGLGTLRRYPEKRWRIAPADVERMAERQSAMLEEAARAVRPGGRVVYSTCSVASTENGDVVARFLAGERGRAFVIDPLGALVPAEWERFIDGAGCFQSWPADGGPDGHFVARLRRSEEPIDSDS